jgi:hypothetical protein
MLAKRPMKTTRRCRKNDDHISCRTDTEYVQMSTEDEKISNGFLVVAEQVAGFERELSVNL